MPLSTPWLATLDLALRAGAIALLLLLALLLLRDFRRTAAGRLSAAFALGSAAYALSSAAGSAALPEWARAPLIALSTGNVVVFWLFTRALFDDGFTVRRWHLMLWAALVAVSLVNCVLLAPAQIEGGAGLNRWTGPALTLLSLGVIALAVGQSIVSWSTDLVEGRRLLRVFIIGAAALDSAVNTAMQLLLRGDQPPLVVSAINAAVLLVIVTVTTWAMTRAAGDEVFQPVAASPAEATDEAAPLAADRKLIAALDRLMSGERVYRQDGVTIGTLATRLGVPEYRLRRLINGRLGYRNFNVFLNNYRIEEAKAALADPAQAAVPVTTIALDSGFQSLGPFNRAFKTETGVTPTEYRRARVPAG